MLVQPVATNQFCGLVPGLSPSIFGESLGTRLSILSSPTNNSAIKIFCLRDIIKVLFCLFVCCLLFVLLLNENQIYIPRRDTLYRITGRTLNQSARGFA